MTLTATTHVQRVHGTEGGAKVHRRHGEPVCGPCLDAERQANRDRARASKVAGERRPDLDGPRKPPAPADALDEWRYDARCIGRADILDPPLDDRGRMSRYARERAVAVCMPCPVRAQCAAWVLALPDRNDPGGVVAALTETDRKTARARARARRAATTREGAK